MLPIIYPHPPNRKQPEKHETPKSAPPQQHSTLTKTQPCATHETNPTPTEYRNLLTHNNIQKHQNEPSQHPARPGTTPPHHPTRTPRRRPTPPTTTPGTCHHHRSNPKTPTPNPPTPTKHTPHRHPPPTGDVSSPQVNTTKQTPGPLRSSPVCRHPRTISRAAARYGYLLINPANRPPSPFQTSFATNSPTMLTTVEN